jgi:hypothetical protein
MNLIRGINTTEFWLSAITTAIAMLVALGIPVKVTSAGIQQVATVAAIVVPAVYTIARTTLKLKSLPALPPPPTTTSVTP